MPARTRKEKSIGERIAKRRHELELSRELLAMQWDVALSTVRNWEIGLSEPRGDDRTMVEDWLSARSAK